MICKKQTKIDIYHLSVTHHIWGFFAQILARKIIRYINPKQTGHDGPKHIQWPGNEFLRQVTLHGEAQPIKSMK